MNYKKGSIKSEKGQTSLIGVKKLMAHLLRIGTHKFIIKIPLSYIENTQTPPTHSHKFLPPSPKLGFADVGLRFSLAL